MEQTVANLYEDPHKEPPVSADFFRCRAGHRLLASVALELDLVDEGVLGVQKDAASNVEAYCSRAGECCAGIDPDVERRALALATSLTSALDPEIVIRACTVCGCTEYAACEAGCTWVTASRCSSCAPDVAPIAKPCGICQATPHDRYCPRAAAAKASAA